MLGRRIVGGGLLMVIGATGACQEPSPTSAPRARPTSSSVQVAEAAFSVGERVVAATSKKNFREGTVVAVRDKEIVFEWGTRRGSGQLEQSQVHPARVWLLGHDVDSLGEGDYAICRVSEGRWVPCRVDAKTASGIDVFTLRGEHHLVQSDQLVRPSEAIRADIQLNWKRLEQREAFDKDLAVAGRPVRPPGWAPTKGDEVVALFSAASWYGASVVDVSAGRAKVRWDGKASPSETLPIGDVVPRPVGTGKSGPDLVVGQFVIVRPRVKSWRWEYAKIVGVNGAELELADRDNRRRAGAASDVVPLVDF